MGTTSEAAEGRDLGDLRDHGSESLVTSINCIGDATATLPVVSTMVFGFALEKLWSCAGTDYYSTLALAASTVLSVRLVVAMKLDNPDALQTTDMTKPALTTHDCVALYDHLLRARDVLC